MANKKDKVRQLHSADKEANKDVNTNADAPQIDEFTELCRVAWCEAYYWLAGAFSFKEEFVKNHLAPFMQQHNVDPDKLEGEEKAKALVAFSSYLLCSGIAKRLEGMGFSKENPPVYNQTMFQTVLNAAQEAFVACVDEFEFRVPFLPYVNVFSRAVFNQELEDLAQAFIFAPAYETTLQTMLRQNGWALAPQAPSDSEEGDEGESEPVDDEDLP